MASAALCRLHSLVIKGVAQGTPRWIANDTIRLQATEFRAHKRAPHDRAHCSTESAIETMASSAIIGRLARSGCVLAWNSRQQVVDIRPRHAIFMTLLALNPGKRCIGMHGRRISATLHVNATKRRK
jgi:hypothetical protein